MPARAYSQRHASSRQQGDVYGLPLAVEGAGVAGVGMGEGHYGPSSLAQQQRGSADGATGRLPTLSSSEAGSRAHPGHLRPRSRSTSPAPGHTQPAAAAAATAGHHGGGQAAAQAEARGSFGGWGAPAPPGTGVGGYSLHDNPREIDFRRVVATATLSPEVGRWLG